MAPGKERQARVPKHSGIGEVGRMTGVQPPKNVPRDSGGMESAAAFFDSPNGTGPISPNKNGNLPNKELPRPSNGNHLGRERPDKFTGFGEVGRKTGVTRAPVARDEHGFEDPDLFFASSPHDSTTASTPRGRQSAGSSPQRTYGSGSRSKNTIPEEDEDSEEEQEEDEMGMDQTVSTPRALKANASNNSINRPRSLQNRSIPHSAKSRGYTSTSATKLVRGRGRASTDTTDWNEISGSQNQMNGQEQEDEEDESSEEEEVVPQGRNARVAKLSMSTVNGTAKSARTIGTPSSVGSTGSRRISIGTPTLSNGARDKGKGRAPPSPEVEENDYIPDDYGGGDETYGGGEETMATLEEEEEVEEEEVEVETVVVDDEDEDEEEEDEDEDEVVAAAVKPKPKPVKKPTPRSNQKKRPASDDEDVRRSSRQRLEPLEYWRNERIVYARRQSGLGIKSVVRIPKTVADLRKRPTIKRSKSARIKSEAPYDDEDEEAGVDDNTVPEGVVWSWEGDAEITRRIAFTKKMVQPQPTYNNKFMFQKIFTELDYLASGILQIPSGTGKPSKPAKDNSYVFYCIEGSVSVVIHRTRFAIGPGGTFFVPRGNSYSITATSNRDVKLFFTQGRRVMEAPDGTARPDAKEAEGEEEEDEEDEEDDEDDTTGAMVNGV